MESKLSFCFKDISSRSRNPCDEDTQSDLKKVITRDQEVKKSDN